LIFYKGVTIPQVLYQEVDRYNVLLRILKQSLKHLELGVQGLAVTTPELEQIMGALLEFKVMKKRQRRYVGLVALLARRSRKPGQDVILA